MEINDYLLAPALLIQLLILNIPSTEGAESFPRAVVLTPLKMSEAFRSPIPTGVPGLLSFAKLRPGDLGEAA